MDGRQGAARRGRPGPVEYNLGYRWGPEVMARITLRQLLDHAAEHGYGVPAFNINNMEQGLAILEAADATKSPVIIQASRGARSYANDIVLKHLIDALAEMYPAIPICMHQDHGNNEATCATAIQFGFTSVMMDGSLKEDAKTPADYGYNVDVTRRVVEMAHSCASPSKANSACLDRLRPEWAKPKTDTAPKASSTILNFSRTPTRRSTSCAQRR